MIKKFTFLIVLLALIACPSPIKAQTFSAEQNVVIEGLKAQLIQILLQQIAVLQEQIKQLVAQQNLAIQQSETSGAIEAVNKQVEEVATGGSAETTKLYVGNMECSKRPNGTYYQLPVTIEGQWRGGLYQVKNLEGKVITGGYLQNGTKIDIAFSDSRNSQGTYLVKIYNSSPIINRMRFPVFMGSPIAEKTGTFTLPSCQ